MKQLLSLFLLYSSFALATPDERPVLFVDLMEICMAHPEFRASSIDFYKPESAKEFEILFYEKSKLLHQHQAMNYVFKQREKNNSKQYTQCVDNILNTWPG